jgi:hypothetical protein
MLSVWRFGAGLFEYKRVPAFIPALRPPRFVFEAGSPYSIEGGNTMKKFFVKTAFAGGLALLLALAVCDNPASDSGDPTLTGTVTLTGLPRVGAVLTADTFGLDGEGDITRQWLRGNTAIAGVSGDTYELTEDDLSYRIKVRVSRSGYSGSVGSNAIGLVSADLFTTIEDISDYLEVTPKGSSADSLAYVPVEIQLTSENWIALIAALTESGKLVNLDLSACTKGEQTSGGGLYSTGGFDANNIEAPTVVGLILPGEATSILATASGTVSRFTTGFTALEEIRGEEIITLNMNALATIPTLVTASFPKAETVGNYVFRYCSNLSAVDLPAMKSLGSYALTGCEALITLHLPANFATITQNPFAVSGITTFTVDPANPTYSASGGMLLSKDGTTLIAYPSAAGDVTLPDTITALGQNALNSSSIRSINLSRVTTMENSSISTCSLLETINAPDLSVISSSAFSRSTALTTLNIPRVTSIASGAFQNCGNTTDLTIFMGAAQPTVTGSLFSGCSGKNVTVKVPAEAITESNYNTAWETALKSTSGINLTVEELTE